VLAVRAAPHAALLFLAATRATLEGSHVLPLVRVAGSGLSPGDVLSLAFLGGASWYLLDRIRSGASPWRAPTVMPAVAFLGWVTLSLAYSPDPGLGARDLLKFAAAYCAFLLVVVDRPDPRRLRLLLAAVVAGAVPPLAFGVAQMVTASVKVNFFHGWWRVQSFFDHPNTYGFYLVVVVAASWALRQHTSGAARRGATIVGAAAFASVMLTLSRNSFAAMALLVLVIGWRQRRVLIAALAVGAAVVIAAPQVVARGSGILTGSPTAAKSNSLEGRLEIWEQGTRLWRSQPVLGRGWGATSAAVGSAAHNDYLRSLVEAGAIGLLLYVSLVWALLRLGRRAAAGRVDAPRALLGLALGYGLVSLASNTLGKGVFQFHFWLVVGVLWVWSETLPADGARPPPVAAAALRRARA